MRLFSVFTIVNVVAFDLLNDALSCRSGFYPHVAPRDSNFNKQLSVDRLTWRRLRAEPFARALVVSAKVFLKFFQRTQLNAR